MTITLLDQPTPTLCTPAPLSALGLYARHESGHVVVAHALGIRVAGMAVKADAMNGEVAGISVIPIEDDVSMFDAACIALAGMAASRMAGIDHATAVQGAWADIADLRNFGCFVHPAIRKMIGPATFDILKKNWSGVLALSAAVADRGQLYEDDIARVLRDAG